MPTAKAHHELPLLEPIKHYIYFRLHYSVSISSRRDGGIAFMVCLPVWHTRWTHTDAGASAAQSHTQHFTTEDTCNLNIRIFNERQHVKTEAWGTICTVCRATAYNVQARLLTYYASTWKSLVFQSGSWLMLLFLHKDSALTLCFPFVSPSFFLSSLSLLSIPVADFFLVLVSLKTSLIYYFSSPASSLIPLFLFLSLVFFTSCLTEMLIT